MTPVSALEFVIIIAILCSGTTARLVRGDNQTSLPEEENRPCFKMYEGCMAGFSIKPSTNADGSLHFPGDFFGTVCDYFITGGICYGLTTYEVCEPSFQPINVIRNFNNISIKLCRNTEALDSLVPCLNDKEFPKAYMSVIDYVGSGKESRCNLAKEQIRRVLRLFKDKCGDAEYTSLKTVMEDFGRDLLSFFLPDIEDPSCSIDVSTLTPDRRRRGVASATIKRMVNLWMS
ncbi:uncharacterized protein LOC130049549 isoform X2 [Ostrea edulis]|uniref:uncharacterized protein LOC125662773 isoform X2 n=1 Tax=Ostrea edulis TaxID=37623 RepID=UPI0024AF94BF|nr:uncharacterized protein LOC125662773 isoform X2 [Ostrea edulis]XP_056003337.1 uncharacterized protein LOC130049549 isoform X2 [Ostrea edulis]